MVLHGIENPIVHFELHWKTMKLLFTIHYHKITNIIYHYVFG